MVWAHNVLFAKAVRIRWALEVGLVACRNRGSLAIQAMDLVAIDDHDQDVFVAAAILVAAEFFEILRFTEAPFKAKTIIAEVLVGSGVRIRLSDVSAEEVIPHHLIAAVVGKEIPLAALPNTAPIVRTTLFIKLGAKLWKGALGASTM